MITGKRDPNATRDAKGIELELYDMILDPKRERLAELYKQTRELQAEVDQLESTLLDRIDGTDPIY